MSTWFLSGVGYGYAVPSQATDLQPTARRSDLFCHRFVNRLYQIMSWNDSESMASIVTNSNTNPFQKITQKVK